LPHCRRHSRTTTKPRRRIKNRIARGSSLTSFKDHFSAHASQYAAFRPAYPKSLFEFLAAASNSSELAWDCATGNGQAARGLAPYFKRVIATDASATQIAAATPLENIEYRAATAEQSGLESASADLIAVAQALHWFDIPGFFAEAKRALRPGGLLAFWCYERNRVDSHCDAHIGRLFAEVETYWPPERDLVENHYRTIDMPFTELTVPAFEMTAEWQVDEILGYFRTWSASQRYVRDRQADPVAIIEAELREAWGRDKRTVRWPLTLRLGRK
jgi:SAM-dependent methyltransferase